MSKSLLTILFFIFPVIWTGCIITTTPQEIEVTIHVGETETFQITVLESQYDIQWALDGQIIADARGLMTFEYAPTIDDVGDHQLLVVDTWSMGNTSGIHPWTWQIHVVAEE